MVVVVIVMVIVIGVVVACKKKYNDIRKVMIFDKMQIKLKKRKIISCIFSTADTKNANVYINGNFS